LDAEQLRSTGGGHWNCYELSWLTPSGKPAGGGLPVVRVSDQGRRIVESKSFSRYLNSFNQTVFRGRAEVLHTWNSDLSL